MVARPHRDRLTRRRCRRQHLPTRHGQPTGSTRPPAYSHDLAQLILARGAEPDYAPGGRLRRSQPGHRVRRDPDDGPPCAGPAGGRWAHLARGGPGHVPPAPRRSRRIGGGPRLCQRGEVGPADVMAARQLIEPQVLPLLSPATQRDLDELWRCVEGGGSAGSAEEFEAWDFALHHAIVAASRNQLLLSMYRVVESAREGKIWATSSGAMTHESGAPPIRPTMSSWSKRCPSASWTTPCASCGHTWPAFRPTCSRALRRSAPDGPAALNSPHPSARGRSSVPATAVTTTRNGGKLPSDTLAGCG